MIILTDEPPKPSRPFLTVERITQETLKILSEPLKIRRPIIITDRDA